MDRELDVIIVGGSFAGLSVASQLRGRRVLILDRKPIGRGQTSACGTTLQTLEALGVQGSLLQVHPALIIHIGARTVRFEVPQRPFCTFDYAAFCRGLLSRSGAEVLQAEVRGLGEGWVETSAGRLSATHVIDCGGWLARNGAAGANGHGLSFGLETPRFVPGLGLHFFLDHQVVPDGAAWVFPCGEFSRVGVASYGGRTRLKGELARFCASLGAETGPTHGGFFPWRLREPVQGRTMRVGDAAGQCIPFSGEGIRPAAFYGVHAGRLLREVLEGRLSLEAALTRYRRLVAERRGFYRFFGLMQWYVRAMPGRLTQRLLALLASPGVKPKIERYYLDTFEVPVS
jgi:flavin-dependent dehydrogenase